MICELRKIKDEGNLLGYDRIEWLTTDQNNDFVCITDGDKLSLIVHEDFWESIDSYIVIRKGGAK